MIFDFLLVGIAFYLAIPGIAGYSARSYGRSFWLWFFLAMVFPIITHFALYFVIKKDIRHKKLISMLKKEEIQYIEEQIEQVKRDQNILSIPKINLKNNKITKE